MRRDEVAKAELVQLVEAYREAARQHGDASERGDHKAANKSADLLAAIYSELRQRGTEAQRRLVPLLADPVPGVRLWAASHALEFAPAKGEAILKQLVAEVRFLGLDAEMTLKEWRAGRLRFP